MLYQHIEMRYKSNKISIILKNYEENLKENLIFEKFHFSRSIQRKGIISWGYKWLLGTESMNSIAILDF